MSGNDGAPNEFDPQRRYRRGAWHRLENAVMTALTRVGVVPHSFVLTTRGRRTGELRRNPVTIVRCDGKQWLVAPYGTVAWVHNARAAGRVALTRRFATTEYVIRAATQQESGPVLRRYIRIASATRRYFEADRDDPVERFAAEAAHHPVFELMPVD